MPPPVEDAAPDAEALSEGRLSQDETSSPSTSPPSAQEPTAQPDSTTLTPVATPAEGETAAMGNQITSDIPPRTVSLPPPVANGHHDVAVAASTNVGSASPSLPTQPPPSMAPASQPPGQDSHPPPITNGVKTQEQLPLFGILKATPVRPPQAQPPVQSPVQPPVQNNQWSHPSLMVQPQPPMAPSSASPPVANAQPGTLSEFDKNYRKLSGVLRNMPADVVRRVVRDNWDKCLTGSDYHSTFMTNAIVHHATTPRILQRAIQDFGHKLVEDGKYQIAHLMTEKQLDEVFSILLPKLSDRFLDAAIAHRLPTIPAKRLLNHLARAERLGYDANDIEEDVGEPEPLPPAPPLALPTTHFAQPPLPSAVRPPPTPSYHHHQAHNSSHSQAAPHTARPAVNYDQRPPVPNTPQSITVPPPRQVQPHVGQSSQAPPQGIYGPFTCSDCRQTFVHESAFQYHERKSICRSNLLGTAVSKCPFCYKEFVSEGGLSYHLANKVCGVYSGSPSELARIKKASSKPASSASSPAPGVPPAMPQSAPQPQPQPHTQPHPLAQTPVPVPVLMQGPRGPPGSVPPFVSSPAGPAGPAGQPLIQSDILPSYQSSYGPPPPSSAPPMPSTPQQPTPSAVSDADLRSGSHLEPAKRLALEKELRNAEDNFIAKIDEAKRSWDPADLERRLLSLKNSHATKQSQIRKKYGIRLRSRRGPSAMKEERVRVGLPADLPPKKPMTPGSAVSTTPVPLPNGSQVLNNNGKRPFDTGAALPSPSHPPVKKLAVSELTGGLGGTSATAAMQDPTAVMDGHDSTGYRTGTPMNPSQSHFAGHSSNTPGSSGPRVQATPQRIQMGVAGRGISREEPVDVDSSSDSGSDIEAE